MKKIYLKIAFAFSLLLVFANAYANDGETMQNMLRRLLPKYAASFIVEKLPDSDVDYFELESRGEKIIIRGNNANSMAVGLNYYLKYYCRANVSWFVNDAIDMPQTLPVIEKKISIKARCKNRFFLNYCTFGYTMPWWNWRDWEHFIDWMALNGVNMPLAITGQESIWRRVWIKMGLTDNEVRAYFTGPAHLPWHRMLNIDRWQGPLPMSWLNMQEELQKKIVDRERQFNMKPILPAFSGHVPADLKRVFPDAKIKELSVWGQFEPQYRSSFLDPTDSLFSKIQKTFIEEQTKLFGTDHIYGVDLFNELKPPSWEPEYLARVSRQFYESLEAADSQAVWLQMAWLFYHQRKNWTAERVKAYITAVPRGRMVLLDYYCDNTEVWKLTQKFYDVPYIWCYLGNFGGNSMLNGNIKEINNRIENTFEKGGTGFEGIGSTLEGFDCNPYIFNFIFEKAWKMPYGDNQNAWIETLADQRSHAKNANYARQAWKLLIDSVYNKQQHLAKNQMTNARPTFGSFVIYSNSKLEYNNKILFRILDLMLKSDGSGSAYEFDIVNIARQTLGNYFADVYAEYKQAYIAKNINKMKANEKIMLQILDDLDELLATNYTFLMGKWIADARSIGINDEEKNYYERNARNIVTTWGHRDKGLNDYASRSWSGLMKTYYAERWKMFFAQINNAVANNINFDEKKYKNDVTKFEEEWWQNCIGNMSVSPNGSAIETTKKLYKKYKNAIKN